VEGRGLHAKKPAQGSGAGLICTVPEFEIIPDTVAFQKEQGKVLVVDH